MLRAICYAFHARLAEDKTLTIGVIEAGPDRSTDETIVSGGTWLLAVTDVLQMI